ncbi:hypothetical protein [Parvularcula lutaonensis]|uniref:Uncharacterized protein n=1 Tax=Parvularcula lutaonensis TaxID=491923 RepID=A0ABV7ME22_9PROT|nr:hypothetical protein [Parvularcula lutaonensis]GGY49545.1 hypothetical protein GCM10007148_17710 [Parvularcula lutaonensis]
MQLFGMTRRGAADIRFMAEGMSEGARLYTDEGLDHIEAAPLFFTDPERLDTLYEAGIPTDVLGIAIGVAQKSKNWIRLQFTSKLLKKIEECSPDILFDMEKKFEFTSMVSRELSGFSEEFIRVAALLEDAIKRQDKEAAARYAQHSLELILLFLGRMNQHYQDFGHFFETGVYNQFRAKLNTMSVGDRRLIEAFYTQFQSGVAVMTRVFSGEIPQAQRNRAVTINHVFRWLSQVSQSVSGMYNAAIKVVNA